jgi:hypothetical protein
MTQRLIILFLAFCFFQGNAEYLQVKHQFTHEELYLARKIIVHNHEILVYDEGGNLTNGDEKVMIFNFNGKYLAQMGKGGEGPGEYKAAGDIIVNNGQLFVLDSLGQAVNAYDLKRREFLMRKRYSNANVFTTPDSFAVDNLGRTYITFGRGIKSSKIISVFDIDMKKQFEFVDCYTTYETQKDEFKGFGRQWDEDIRKFYYNQSYIAVSPNKLYFATWLFNEVFEFSLEGKFLKKYQVPLESIAETVPIVKTGNFKTIERRLIYHLLFKNNQLYLLSRDNKGNSVIFILKQGVFKEIYRLEEELFSFDMTARKLMAVNREDSIIYIYDI